jgi:effector-binding domain-containing protein
MSEAPSLVTLEPTTVALVRERVPMSRLTAFFDRVFSTVMGAVSGQGVTVTGPPFARYYGVPSETVDVAAGFPTSAPITTSDGVTAAELPGGPAAQLLYVGGFDGLERAYGQIESWMGRQGLHPAHSVWESYLTMPTPDSLPEENETLITWPVADSD